MSLDYTLPPADLRLRLRALCDAAGVTPSELAKRAGKQPSLINKFLAGKTENPAQDTLGALERAALDVLCGAARSDEPVAGILREIAEASAASTAPEVADMRQTLVLAAGFLVAGIARIDGLAVAS